MRTLWHDLAYALRMARRNRGFTAVALLSLALGIAANTLLFTLVYAVLLRPLPYEQPDRLMRLIHGTDETYVTMPEFEFWKDHAQSFESAGAYRYGGDRNLQAGSETERLNTVAVSSAFFRTLGVRMAAGRDFDGDETRAGGPDAVILTHKLWNTAFGGDAAILGRTIILGDKPSAVAGILPADFWFPEPVDAFVPLRATGSVADTGTNTAMIVRLRPNVSVRQAAAESAALREPFQRESSLAYPVPLEDQGSLSPVPFQYWLTGDVRLVLLVIFAAAGVLFVIACANLASLVLARLVDREREIAVRLALGSSRGRLARQFLAENLILALAGAALGFLLAWWTLPAALSLIPFQLPAAGQIRLNLPVMLFTSAVSVAAGVLLSVMPCWSSSRMGIHDALKRGGRPGGLTSSRNLTRTVLVTGQIALSVVLLVSALLLSESLYHLSHQELGFKPGHLTTFHLTMNSSAAGSAPAMRSQISALAERFATLSGVEDVANVNFLPFGEPNNFPTQRFGHPEQSIGGMEIRVVGPKYFETMGIPIRAGRGFSAADSSGTTPVIAISETVARRWWPNGNTIGNLIVVGLFQGQAVPEGSTPYPPRTIVGVVGDARTADIKERPRPTVYIPYTQTDSSTWNWIIRGDLPKGFAEQLRAAVVQVDPRFRVQNLVTMDDTIAAITADSRFDALLFGMFAGTAVLLACIGIFGLLSFSVLQRTREIGTRLALGAGSVQVLGLVLRDGFAILAGGLVLGIGAAMGVTRFLSKLLFGVQNNSVLTYVSAGVLLLVVGMLASYLPARRAMKIDPLAALRSE